jgi:uncharacterized membrane protein
VRTVYRALDFCLHTDTVCSLALFGSHRGNSLITELIEDDHRLIIVKPNKSATWRTNLYVLIAVSIPSLGAAIGFTLLGAWPILPFAGAELIGLGAALYYVNWKLEYRQVVTFHAATIKIEKGYFVPKRTWLWQRDDTGT